MEVKLSFRVMLDDDVWSTAIDTNVSSDELDRVFCSLDEAIAKSLPVMIGGGARRLWIPTTLLHRCVVSVEPQPG